MYVIVWTLNGFIFTMCHYKFCLKVIRKRFDGDVQNVSFRERFIFVRGGYVDT